VVFQDLHDPPLLNNAWMWHGEASKRLLWEMGDRRASRELRQLTSLRGVFQEVSEVPRVKVVVDSYPVERFLVSQVTDPPRPNGRPSNVAPLAHEKIAGLNREPFTLVVGEFHRQQVISVNAPPLHIDVAQVGDSWQAARLALVEHLP